MKCHLTIGPSVPILVTRAGRDPYNPDRKWEFTSPEPRDCIGSECSAWNWTGDGRGFCGLVVAAEPPAGAFWKPETTLPDPAAKREEP